MGHNEIIVSISVVMFEITYVTCKTTLSKMAFSFADGAEVKCDFSKVLTTQTVSTTFYDFDFGRTFSHFESSKFQYAHEHVLIDLLNASDCYQTIEQRCQPWVERLYNIDHRIPKYPVSSEWSWSSVHPCFCLKFVLSLSPKSPTNHSKG